MSLILGVDPGKNGGIAWTDGADFGAVRMPEGDDAIHNQIVDLLDGYDVVAFIEKLPYYVPMPMNSVPLVTQVSSTAKLHENCGLLRGILVAAGATIHEVPPQVWQTPLDIGKKRGQPGSVWKNKLKAAAQERFPDMKVTLANADALLILHYGLASLDKK
jgi:hypothetical protein